MEYLLGVVVAIVVEGVKKYGQTEGFGTMIALLIVSLIGGWAYVYFLAFPFWETVAQALLYGAGLHNLILKRLIDNN